MIKFLLMAVLLAPVLSSAKTLEYGFIGGKWMCGEEILKGKNHSEYIYKGCNQHNLKDILERDDLVWKKDGNFHTNSYNEYKPQRNTVKNCGLTYNPKDGKTYKYPACVKTFKDN